jgi:hypothetical protein
LFYLNQTKEGTIRRLVIREDEKQFLRNVILPFMQVTLEEINMMNKIRKHYYWSDYYNETVQMSSTYKQQHFQPYIP